MLWISAKKAAPTGSWLEPAGDGCMWCHLAPFIACLWRVYWRCLWVSFYMWKCGNMCLMDDGVVVVMYLWSAAVYWRWRSLKDLLLRSLERLTASSEEEEVNKFIYTTYPYRWWYAARYINIWLRHIYTVMCCSFVCYSSNCSPWECWC